eukprot:TRINITY_DN12057_c0_g1_i1.p1 TRINITY_DN12057_c0_g1~~TRINITY_DN12057_c0_g1_i1.p1  ORF type:complete len:418 (+),score=103.37 TRINITY_DN12057_c0_g1_i1:36-1256(+)
MELAAIVRIILVVGMLVSGSINTLSKKWQNDSTSTGIGGVEQSFEEPWTQSLFMFTGEAICMLGYFATIFYERHTAQVGSDAVLSHASYSTNVAPQDEEEPIIASSRPKDRVDIMLERYPALEPFLFLFTSFFDLIGTTLAGIGLLYTPASVYQMLRGAIIVFSGVLSMVFLKRQLFLFNWIGIATTTFGLVLVGMSSVFGESDSSENSDGGHSNAELALFGDVLIVLAQLASAFQMIVQETFLKRRSYPPLQIVGSEGVWGVIMMLFFVLPICYFIPGDQYGSYENAINGFIMIGHNWILLVLVITYTLSIAFYNFFGLSVAKQLTTVHRTFIDACRTVIVWVVEVMLFYITGGSIGQEWVTPWSFLQLAGFGFLVLGTFIYNAVLRIPKVYYPTAAEQEKINQK